MRKFRILFLPLIIIALFSLNSCSGSDEPIDGLVEDTSNVDPNNPDVPTGVFKADFNGATWTATTTQVIVSQDHIEILAEKPNGESFVVSVEGTLPGTYKANENILAFTPKETADNFGYWSMNDDNPDENTGSITITSIDTANKTISGTFNFKGYWSDGDVSNIVPIVFTNGVFKDIPYIQDNTQTGGSGVVGSDTDTFYAKLDGTEFVENAIDVVKVDGLSVPHPYYSIVGKKNNSGGNIGLSVATSLSVGTYEITDSFDSQVKSSCIINDVLYNSESGSVTITSKTATHMTGTFNAIVKNFTSGNTKTISEGTFSVDLP